MKNTIITITTLSFLAGCGVLGSAGNSAGSSAGSSAGGSSATSSGGSSAGVFKNRVKEVELEQPRIVIDERGYIPVVSEVTVDKFKGGALVKARGLVDSIGYSEVDLMPVNKGIPDENGLVILQFRANKPEKFRAPATERAKQVYAGASIPAARMPYVREIRVIAAQNQISVSN